MDPIPPESGAVCAFQTRLVSRFHDRRLKVPTPSELHDERAALLSKCTAALDLADTEDRALTAAEQEVYDRDTTKIRSLNLQLDSGQRPTFRGALSYSPDETPIGALDEPGSRHMPSFHPAAKLQAFPNNRAGQERAYRCGQWVLASLLGNVKALNWCTANGVKVDVMAAHSAGVNIAGGVLVPDELSATIIKLVDEYGTFRRNTRVVPMTSDTQNIPRRTGGLTAAYVSENTDGSANESTTSWDNVQLVAKKLMVLTRMSSEIAEDAIISMVDMLAQECALAFAIKEDTVGFTGTGISTDGGITGILVKALQAGFTKAKVAAVTPHNTLPEITSGDLIKLMSAIPMYAKARSAWYCSPSALDLVFNTIKVAAGGNSLENLQNEVRPRFLGYPIELSPVFPDDPTADYNGLVMLAFGNLAQASTLGSRREIRFRTSEERYWELDQVGIKATMRHDININDLGSTVIKSPFAVLVGTT
jgi:HK97 family phage major capsid protein